MVADEDLIRRFVDAADDSAFNELVERHQRDVYRLAYRFTGNHADANDLAQEAFLRVFTSLGRFRGEARFKTWLYRIVANLSLNHLQRTRRERGWRVPINDVDPSVPSRTLEGLVAGEDRDALDGAIGALPDKQRKTLVLKVFHDLKFTEVAQVMRCSVGTAKANYFHAVQGLKKRMGQLAIDSSKETAT